MKWYEMDTLRLLHQKLRRVQSAYDFKGQERDLEFLYKIIKEKEKEQKK